MNDNSLITFGRYKFTALCRVPVDYLFSICKQNTNNFRKNSDPYNQEKEEIKQYVKDNLEILVLRKEGIIQPLELKQTCHKVSYFTEKIAKQVLKSISLIDQDHKKPIRVYECEKCSNWHLTSQTLEEYNKN